MSFIGDIVGGYGASQLGRYKFMKKLKNQN